MPVSTCSICGTKTGSEQAHRPGQDCVKVLSDQIKVFMQQSGERIGSLKAGTDEILSIIAENNVEYTKEIRRLDDRFVELAKRTVNLERIVKKAGLADAKGK
jgi:hypothetical protein